MEDTFIREIVIPLIAVFIAVSLGLYFKKKNKNRKD